MGRQVAMNGIGQDSISIVEKKDDQEYDDDEGAELKARPKLWVVSVGI